jgi:hypothetical protein
MIAVPLLATGALLFWMAVFPPWENLDFWLAKLPLSAFVLLLSIVATGISIRFVYVGGRRMFGARDLSVLLFLFLATGVALFVYLGVTCNALRKI